MRVVILSTTDCEGGAGRAAFRLHKSLRALGYSSAMLVQRKTSTDPDVAAVPPAEKPGSFFWQQIQSHWIEQNRASLSNTYFSLGVPGTDVSSHPLVRQADIINLHWVADFLSAVDIRSSKTAPRCRTPIFPSESQAPTSPVTRSCDRPISSTSTGSPISCLRWTSDRAKPRLVVEHLFFPRSPRHRRLQSPARATGRYHQPPLGRRFPVCGGHQIEQNRASLSNTYFSLGVPGTDVSSHPLVRQADIINLHWVADFLSAVDIRSSKTAPRCRTPIFPSESQAPTSPVTRSCDRPISSTSTGSPISCLRWT